MKLNVRKTMVFCTVFCTILALTSIGIAQEPLSELPIIHQLETDITIRDLDWNVDSALLAFVVGHESVSVINIETGEIDLQLDSDDEIYVIRTIAWSPTQNHLFIANNFTKIWDYSSRDWLDDFEFPNAIEFEEYTPEGNVDWHPNGDQLAMVLRECDEGTPYSPAARVEVWNIANSTYFPVAGCLWTSFNRIKWNPQGTLLAIGSFANFHEEGYIESEEIEIWDVDTRERVLTITDLKEPLGLAWSPTGDMIAFTTRIELDRFLQVWHVTNDELVSHIETNLAVYVPLDWHPSENLIVTGGRDGSVRIWDALNGFELVELPVHEAAVNDVSWSPDGNMLASVGSDGRLYVWDVSDLQESAD